MRFNINEAAPERNFQINKKAAVKYFPPVYICSLDSGGAADLTLNACVLLFCFCLKCELCWHKVNP